MGSDPLSPFGFSPFWYNAALLLVVVAGLALGCTNAIDRVWTVAARLLDRVVKKPAWASVALVGIIGTLVAAATSLNIQMPAPAIHDDFGVLLAAETFVKGRLTNPTHPMWEWFESFHIFFQPTYMTKYPPGQSLLVASGIVLTGMPATGLWLGVGLAGASACWMLRGWVSPRWALVGGLLVALHPLVLQWSQMYHGGLGAMTGGAIVLGAVKRVVDHRRVADAMWLGVGLVILTITRPFEGLLFSLPVAAVLIGWMFTGRQLFVEKLRRVALPTGCVLAAGMAWMAYDNHRVTGDALTLPYTHYTRLYNAAPLFLFQAKQEPPTYRHDEITRFNIDYERSNFTKITTPAGWRDEMLRRYKIILGLYLAPTTLALTALGMFMGPVSGRTVRWFWLPVVQVVAVLSGILVSASLNPHYVAPIGAPLVLLAVVGLIRLSGAKTRDRWVGRGLVIGVLAASTVATAFWVAALSRDANTSWNYRRVMLLEEFAKEGGKHLVIVRYTPDHLVHNEWVYNEPDIDAADVVWARDRRGQNGPLLDYFRDRAVWVLDVSGDSMRLLPYR